MAVESSGHVTVQEGNASPRQIYISFSRQDIAVADLLRANLEAAGFVVFIDNVVAGGSDWWQSLLAAIRTCDVFVTVVSRASIDASTWSSELQYATALRKPIIPVRVDASLEPSFLPPPLARLQMVDYGSGGPDVVALLIRALRTIRPSPLPDSLPPAPGVPESEAPNQTVEPEPAGSSEPQPTVLGIISRHGHIAAPSIVDFVRLGAAVQYERRFRINVSDVSELTRSVSLWTVAHLSGDIARILAAHGLPQAELTRLLSLTGPPDPSPVDDVAVHEELARALDTHLGSVTPQRTIGLVDIAIAVLRDAQTHGGLMGTRVADMDVGGAIADLDLLQAAEPAPASTTEQSKVQDRGIAAEAPTVTEGAGLYLGFHTALRASGEAWPPDAADLDANALWAAFALVASRHRGTMATLVTQVVLQLRGESPTRRDRSAALRAFGISGEIDPVPVEEIDDLADHPLLVEAILVRDRVEPVEPIHLRHLIAATIERGPGPLGPETRDRDIETLRNEFLRQIDHDAPTEVAAQWRAYFAESAATRPDLAPPTPVVEGPSGRALAGLGVDMVDDDTRLSDELHVVDDVVTLCDVLAARGAAPPISVGLFGRWGSGKSYFMALMRRRIDELRLAARGAQESGQETTYCTEIVQVTFNAWHYMDADDLWATMAVHLFGAIAQVDPDDHSARPRADVVRDLQEREEQMETVDRRITKALSDDRLDKAAARMGLESQRAAVLGLLEEVGKTASYISAAKVLVTKKGTRTRRWWSLALVAIVVALATAGVLMLTGSVSREWFIAWIPVAAMVIGTATKWLGGIKKGLAEVNRIAAESGLQPKDITAERVENDHRILELRAELEAIDRLTGVHDWLQGRARSSDYTSHFGVISVLRGDLEALVEKQRRDAPDRRIILYIDDLDRCSPGRVVEVLQAVHLLLAFPLFVAVVGVDPRWLLRSLERHYLQIQSMPGRTPSESADLLTETTPHDYLEKIFQIPFSLRHMESEGYGRLIGSVAGPPARQPPPDDGAGTSALAGTTSADRQSPDRSDPNVVGQTTTETPESTVDTANQPTPTPATPPTQQASGESVAPDSASRPGQLAPVSPNPPQLQITALEVAALARMGPLIGTPRAAKRLVNLYRLIRAGLPEAEIQRFVDEAQFRPLAIVLAAQVGFPRTSSAMLTELVTGKGEARITERVDQFAADAERSDQTESARNETDRADWAAFKKALRSVCVDKDGQPEVEFDRPVSELQHWIPRLRRFSFEGALGPAS